MRRRNRPERSHEGNHAACVVGVSRKSTELDTELRFVNVSSCNGFLLPVRSATLFSAILFSLACLLACLLSESFRSPPRRRRTTEAGTFHLPSVGAFGASKEPLLPVLSVRDIDCPPRHDRPASVMSVNLSSHSAAGSLRALTSDELCAFRVEFVRDYRRRDDDCPRRCVTLPGNRNSGRGNINCCGTREYVHMYCACAELNRMLKRELREQDWSRTRTETRSSFPRDPRSGTARFSRC